MSVEKAGARALIVGVFAELAVMAAHPSHVGPPVLGPHTLATIVHSVALVAAPFMAFGAFGVSRFLGLDKWLSVLAVTLFAFATVSIMGAALMSGVVQPQIIESELPRDFARYTHVLNQAFANLYTALTAFAILAWSVAWPRDGRIVKISGVVVSLAILALQVSGHLTLNIHGMGAVALAQGGWLLGAAAVILRKPAI